MTDKLNYYRDKCTNIHDRPARHEHRITSDYHRFVHFASHARKVIIRARKLNVYVYGSKSKYIMDEDLQVTGHTLWLREYRIGLLGKWQLATGLNMRYIVLLHSWFPRRTAVRSQNLMEQKRNCFLRRDSPSTCLSTSSPRITEWIFKTFDSGVLVKFNATLKLYIFIKGGHK